MSEAKWHRDLHSKFPSAGSCAKRKWDEAHYLYDEWFDNHDQIATQGAPAYRSVHEQFAIIPGHR
ncbi:MAG: hypothetical protein QM718_14595 [Steroidobacteraceae bacterium]